MRVAQRFGRRGGGSGGRGGFKGLREGNVNGECAAGLGRRREMIAGSSNFFFQVSAVSFFLCFLYKGEIIRTAWSGWGVDAGVLSGRRILFWR